MASAYKPPNAAADCGSAIFNEATFEAVAELLSGDRMQTHLRSLCDSLERTVSQGPTPDEVRSIAHQLVSYAGMLGFEQICSCSREVENAPPCAGLANKIAALRQAMHAAAPTLDRLLAGAA